MLMKQSLINGIFKSLTIRSINVPALLSSVRNLSQYRTHYCNEVSTNDVGKSVRVCGWLQLMRYNKFLVIRDSYDTLQVFIPDELGDKLKKLNLTMESVLSIEGVVRLRPKGNENPNMKSGSIEIECKDLNVLNYCKPQLPFQINEFHKVNETTRLKYRYLDLRLSNLQSNIKLRSSFVSSVRSFLHENKFFDIETPTLFRRTPGGAREFIVPTRYEKKFYSLTQSPQQFKQLLMVAGFDRYYQIARCYRDEELKADRQPEFTQIDLEMSFINEEDCIKIIESMLEKCWPLENKLQLPFKRLKYADAMRFYGIDKPDLRFDMKFSDLSDLFRTNKSGISKVDELMPNSNSFGFKVPATTTTDDVLKADKIEKLFKKVIEGDKVKDFNYKILILKGETNSNSLAKHMQPEFRANINKIFVMKDDLVVVIVSDNEPKLLELLGKLRLELANYIDNENKRLNNKYPLLRDPNKFEFEWVVDFPLFTFNEDTKALESTHHPFTAPKPEHVEWVKKGTNLDKVLGQHYDLVLNGNEIAGGSIRIHDASLQKHVLSNILKEDVKTLEHLIEALDSGAPPHGGIAIGLDRFMSILCHAPSIRDVIAFPKSSWGRDLMSDSPSTIPKSELDFYKIQFIPDENSNASEKQDK